MRTRPHHHDANHDRGLAFDLSTMLTRRRLLSMATGAGALALAACSADGADSAVTSATTEGTTATSATTASPATTAAGAGAGSTTTAATTAATAATTAATAGTTASTATAGCDEIPEETAGPFPGDGSNGPNVLAESGVVRSDIRSSIGSASGVAEGVPLTIELTLTDTATGCVPLAGAAVYLWHCDRDGNYSMYSAGVEDENYLRGVQESDAAGRVTFTSIFPACYAGRWPHIHFEVYASVDQATGGGDPIATSQLAFPEDICNTVYATDGYDQSARDLAGVSLVSDGVFRDDQAVHQLATVTGETTAGYAAVLAVGV